MSDRIYDVIGIGFGPANMALAVALEEEAEAPGGKDLRRLFLESKRELRWHPGLLLEDSLIQISVLKDLVTVHNPRSRYTFLNYLKAQGRLFEFLNLRNLFPTRIEFNDYLSWVAGELAAQVRYGQEVVAVSPVRERDSGAVELLRVRAKNRAGGEPEEYLTRDLVVATGGVPCLPEGLELPAGGRAFHARDFLQRIHRDFPDRDAPHRFIVVGAGQSGAELFYYLATRYRNSDVTAAIRRFAYKPVDDSDFTNEIFFPQMVDMVFSLPEERRKAVVDSFRDVNYAVVDTPLIRDIYRFLYQEKVERRDRARIRSFVELRRLEERGEEVVAEFEDLLHDRPLRLTADAVVLATGFQWPRPHPLLEELSPYLLRDAEGSYRMERDYRIAATPELRPRVFLQGFSEETHGIGETVLSLVPVRAQDILATLRTPRRAAQPAPALDPEHG